MGVGGDKRWTTTCKKMCFDQNHAPNANINSKRVMNMNVRHKATQFQKETLEKILVTLNLARFS